MKRKETTRGREREEKGKTRTGIRKEKGKIKGNGNRFKETGEALKVGRNEKMKVGKKKKT